MRTETRWSHVGIVLAAVLLLATDTAAPAVAQSVVVYDASQRTLPQAQGWTMVEDINPPMSYPLDVDSGNLHLSTLGFGNNVPDNNGGGVWWQRSDVQIDFSTDFSVEVMVRIAGAPDHSVNTTTSWPRPGYALTVYDVHGRIFWIGLGSGEVFLSNTAFGQYGSGNTVTLTFNTTDAYHVYRIERAAGGVGAALRIDGVQRMELPVLGPVENAGALIYFGDPTYWANSESYTARVRYGNTVLGVVPASRAGLLWASAPGCPAVNLGVAFRAEEAGTLACEIFDTMGRRVTRSERPVHAGQNGSFEAAGAHRNGLYYYRLRLAGASGRVSEASGRVVLIR